MLSGTASVGPGYACTQTQADWSSLWPLVHLFRGHEPPSLLILYLQMGLSPQLSQVSNPLLSELTILSSFPFCQSFPQKTWETLDQVWGMEESKQEGLGVVRPSVPTLLVDTSIVLDHMVSRQLLFYLAGSNVQGYYDLTSWFLRSFNFYKYRGSQLFVTPYHAQVRQNGTKNTLSFPLCVFLGQ